MEDEAILALFFSRSEEAVGALDEKYGALARRLSRNLVGSPEDAEECVNDAYLAVWNAVPPERPERLMAYLCRIVRNRSLSRRRGSLARKRSATGDVALEELAECLASPEGTEDAVEARELTRLLESFLQALSEENRVIFLRRYWFSDTYEEIGRRTGLTVKNVSVRLTRMRKQLKAFLEAKEVFI